MAQQVETVDQQLRLDQALFAPAALVRALRDSRYRHPANAIAELIDNSIDARAARVEILVEEQQEKVRLRNVWRVHRIAVVDDGRGMDDAALLRALRFGARTDRGAVNAIGKYGMGLPTSSASQCKRVDVWTWQHGGKPRRSFIDIGEAERGQWSIPIPVVEEIPREWVQRIRNLDPENGTLVVWSEIDRITTRAETIFREIERETGRIYRHFINDGEIAIRMARFRGGRVVNGSENDLRPTDPLFLMPNSSTSPPWDKDPMCRPYPGREQYRFDVGGREEIVEVRYSIAKPGARDVPDGFARRAGDLPHGKDAKRNSGVSIVREGRELLLDQNLFGGGGTAEDTRNRWWGCEIRFGRGCDDLFGVDHNKQMATKITAAAKELDTADANLDEEVELAGHDDDDTYQLLSDVRATIMAMRREIDQRNAQSKGRRGRMAGTPEGDAIDRANQVTAAEVDATGPQSETDRDFTHSEEERVGGTAEYLEVVGVEDPVERAREIVLNGTRYQFLPQELDGSQMFNVRRREGVLFVGLNMHHPLYEFVQYLEQHEEQPAHQAAAALRTLLLAWARTEDVTASEQMRTHIQDFAIRWGNQAAMMLPRESASQDG